MSARNLEPGNRGLVGGAQASRGALTVQKARILHRPHQQELIIIIVWKIKCNELIVQK